MMQPVNRLGQQRRDRDDGKLVAHRTGRKPESRHGVGDDDPVNRGIGKRLLGARHEEPVGDTGENSARAALAGSLRGAHRVPPVLIRSSTMTRSPPNLAGEQVAETDAGAAVLFDERLSDRPADRCLQRLPQQVSALAAAQVR